MRNLITSLLLLLVIAGACGDSGSDPLEATDGATSLAADGDDTANGGSKPEDADIGDASANTGLFDGSSSVLDSGSASLRSDGQAGFVDAGPARADGKAPSPTVSNTIETVGFDQSTGGFAIPILLFQGGYASFNVDQIVKPIDIAYDVIEHPADWPAWRRTAMGLERQTPSGWQPLMYKYECAALPKGTTLAGMFERRTDTVIGSEAGVQTLNRYRFAGDGTFESCEMKTTVIVVAGSVTTKKTQHKGTYEVDGYKIVFRYDDGSSSTLPFFYDPMRPTRLWIGREPFPNPTTNSTAICVAP